MIRVEVIEQFTLKDYEKIKDSIKRKSIDVQGTLFIGDTFECTKEMADYLMGNNKNGDVVVKVIEVEPEKVIQSAKDDKEFVEPIKPKKKKTSKK